MNFDQDINLISERIMDVMESATSVRDMVVDRYENEFEDLYKKYNITSNSLIGEMKLECVMDGKTVFAEFDPLTHEWFPVKARGGDDCGEEMKAKYLKFINDLTSMGKIRVETIKMELRKINIEFLNFRADSTLKFLIINAEYKDDIITGIVVIPLEKSECLSLFAKIN
jgi:hypothetical protein